MDIALRYDPLAEFFDLAIDEGDLATDEGLETSVILSLFTDRRALEEDRLPDGTTDRRGWWADAYADRPIGSRLWLLYREKTLDEVLRRARTYAEEALAWMVEDGLAKRVAVEAWNIRHDTLGLRIQIYRPTGLALDRQYDYVWRQAA